MFKSADTCCLEMLTHLISKESWHDVLELFQFYLKKEYNVKRENTFLGKSYSLILINLKSSPIAQGSSRISSFLFFLFKDLLPEIFFSFCSTPPGTLTVFSPNQRCNLNLTYLCLQSHPGALN